MRGTTSERLRSSGRGTGEIAEGEKSRKSEKGKRKGGFSIKIKRQAESATDYVAKAISPRRKDREKEIKDASTSEKRPLKVEPEVLIQEPPAPLWDRVPDVTDRQIEININKIESSTLFNAECLIKEGKWAKWEEILRNRICLLLDPTNYLDKDSIDRICQLPDWIEPDSILGKSFLDQVACARRESGENRMTLIRSVVRALEKSIAIIVKSSDKSMGKKMDKIIRCYEALDGISLKIRSLDQQWHEFRKWRGGQADGRVLVKEFYGKYVESWSRDMVQATSTISLQAESFPRVSVIDVVGEFERQCGNLSNCKTGDEALKGLRTALGNLQRNIRACWSSEFNGEKELLVLWRKDFRETVYRSMALGIAALDDEHMILAEVVKFQKFNPEDQNSQEMVRPALELNGLFRGAVLAVSSAPTQVKKKLESGRVRCSPELAGILEDWANYCKNDENAKILKEYKGTGCMQNEKAMPMSNERAEAVMEAIKKGREFQGAFLSELKFTETELNEYFAAECKARSDLYRNDTDKREAAINNLTRKHEYALRGCLPRRPTSD